MSTNKQSIQNSAITLLTLLLCTTANAANYDAMVSFSNKITLSLPVTGIVNKVNIARGAQVTAGQTLLELEQVPFTTAVTRARAGVTRYKTQKTEADRDLSHAQELYDRAVLSAVSLENAKLAHERATAELDAAEAKLIKANYNLTHSRLLAPFDGWILAVHVQENETINNRVKETALVTLAQEKKYTATARIPLDTLRKLRAGQSLNVTVGNDSFDGKLTSSSLEPVNAKIGKDAAYEIDVMFSSSQLIHAGQIATLVIP